MQGIEATEFKLLDTTDVATKNGGIVIRSTPEPNKFNSILTIFTESDSCRTYIDIK